MHSVAIRAYHVPPTADPPSALSKVVQAVGRRTKLDGHPPGSATDDRNLAGGSKPLDVACPLF